VFDVVAKIGFERDMFIHFTSLDMKKKSSMCLEILQSFLIRHLFTNNIGV